ncbi:deoxyribose-phosphate aldolase [Cylindrospermopsis raciborskii S07]|uniref:Deoxyribose-phosphate aldolase n=1 Tax=Cylindrospermopsis raciborskii C07 TaxID=2014886 RepID=A0ABX4WS01_9CYAN|nr:deoxyribose-phosphate aldolase [Cylindrospermopsis raciborskii]PNJ98227.1 deoxyribose-phosphate aldolase [Cylindrospermopsis raciborskii C03]PNJ98760.1 deoxyribose-phosphate aldolase [Cylindrospermopsis raciborskii C04]PNK00226.1 deoxyribose-phosphate aldolase [Cylindrospermopsis raciborskii C07]PNK06111.1 deoxyribose-phosphate aldolase [Cylindrospermopsis raciborskii S10]PNK09529.1 deoxyribose-phosphate aldolase [Cylindrospermopsis raciborskii S14]
MTTDYPKIDIAPFIDHSLLLPTTTEPQVEKWCEDAYRLNFAAVCIHPSHVKQAAELLHNKKPQVCTVIGFPTGLTTSTVKLYEAQEAVENGATELDLMINLGWLKIGKTEQLHREIATICEETGKPIKVILETSLLTDTEKKVAAEIAMDAGAAFLKTSTGWNGGATVKDVEFLKQITKERVGIKASGGIRTHQDAIDLIMAGATRLGTSRGIDLLHQRLDTEKSQG